MTVCAVCNFSGQNGGDFSALRAPATDTYMLARAFIARAVRLGDLRLAAMIGLGFHALLRTGKLLAIQFQDLEVSLECGIVSLKCSKSGLPTGGQEAVALRDPLCLQILDALIATASPAPGEKLWAQSAHCFRVAFKRLINFFNAAQFQLRPYSLRRGGGTFLLQGGMAMEAILVRGRWKSLAVGRLYLEDGLSQVPSLRLAPEDRAQLPSWAK